MGSIIDISEVLLEAGLSASATETERAIASTAIRKAEGLVKKYLKYDPVQRTRTEFYPTNPTNDGGSGREFVWEANASQAVAREVSPGQTSSLQLQHLPIRSITTLHIDTNARSGTTSGSFGADTLKSQGDDYWPNFDSVDSSGNSVCNDGILRSFGLWPISTGSVKVVYIAGYTAAELHGQDTIIDASPIYGAVLDESLRRLKKAFVTMKQAGAGFLAGAITSEKLGDYAYTISGSDATNLFGSMISLMPETVQALDDSGFVNMGYALGG